VYLIRFVINHNKKFKDFVKNYLSEFQKNGMKLRTDIRKISDYYVPANSLLNDLISILQRGSKLTENEMKKTVYAAILTPIFDDLLDMNMLPVQNQKELFLNTENYTPLIVEDKIVHDSLLNISKLGLLNKTNFEKSKMDVFNSQYESLKQFDTDVSRDVLINILNYKSEAALVFYYCLLDLEYSHEVEKSIRKFARLGQMTNDLFDVYKDYREGIRTYANTCENFEVLERKFLEDSREFCKFTRSLGYPQKQTERYLGVLSVVLGRGLVMVRQLLRLQKKEGKGPLPFDKLPRHEFIGDMEKPINMFRVMQAMKEILE
jgi:hypothetical protein